MEARGAYESCLRRFGRRSGLDGERGHSLGAELLSERLERADVLARKLGAAGIAHATDHAAALCRVSKHAEFRPTNRVRHVEELQAEAKIGLVAAVSVNGLVVGQPCEGLHWIFVEQELCDQLVADLPQEPLGEH